MKYLVIKIQFQLFFIIYLILCIYRGIFIYNPKIYYEKKINIFIRNKLPNLKVEIQYGMGYILLDSELAILCRQRHLQIFLFYYYSICV